MNNQQLAIKHLRLSDFFIGSKEDEVLLRLDDIRRFTYFYRSISIYQISQTTGESGGVYWSYGGVVFDKPWKGGRESNYDYDAVVLRLEVRTLDAYKILELNHDSRIALISKVKEDEYNDMMDFVRGFERHARFLVSCAGRTRRASAAGGQDHGLDPDDQGPQIHIQGWRQRDRGHVQNSFGQEAEGD